MEANDIRALAAAQPQGRALDQVFYHDEAIYRKELDRLFMRSWLYAGHISEIPRVGDWFLYELDRESVIILADHVTLEQGTGCVHTAPGHGQEDYEVGQRYGLEVFAPVNDEGRFTKDAPPFEGQFVFEADPNVTAELGKKGALLKDSKLAHAYPHCWRCKEPIIYRATEQWFISMETNGLAAAFGRSPQRSER